MRDEDRTIEEFARELTELRERVAESRRQEAELRQLKEALKESEEKYRMAFEWTGTAMMVVDEDTMISMVNHKAEEVTGYPAEEVNERRK